MINNEKNIENGMMEWRDENDGLEDGGMLRNQVMMKHCLKKR